MSAFRLAIVGEPDDGFPNTLLSVLGSHRDYGIRPVAVAGLGSRAARELRRFLSSDVARRAAIAAGNDDVFDPRSVELYDTAGTMLANSELHLDGVIVAGSTDAMDTSVAALNAKLHVLTDVTSVIEDPRALAKLREVASKNGRTFVAGHLSGIRFRPPTPPSIGTPSGVTAEWHAVPSSDEMAPKAARLLALTTPVVAALDGAPVTLHRVVLLDGARFVRGVWRTGLGQRVQIDVERGWEFGYADHALLTAFGHWKKTRVEVQLVPPGMEDGPNAETLARVLSSDVRGPRTLELPPDPVTCHRQRLLAWVRQCSGYGRPWFTVEEAITAAQMARDLARGLQGWKYDHTRWTQQ